jgi:hypothetical protein
MDARLSVKCGLGVNFNNTSDWVAMPFFSKADKFYLIFGIRCGCEANEINRLMLAFGDKDKA